MDYPCGKFDDFRFSRFGFITQTDRQNHTQTDANNRLTHVTTVGVTSDVKLTEIDNKTLFRHF